MKSILFEAFLVAMAGAMVAFAANALSPSGLRLNRNYFPGSESPRVAASANPSSTATPTATPAFQTAAVAARLKQKGLRLADGKEAAELYADPRRGQGLVVFVDARDDAHYAAGHIPGAYQFDHYHPERYFGDVLPACNVAQQVVVYCTGGECEDSEFAAVMLGDAGVPKEKLLVYGGGMTEWEKTGMPIEKQTRNSGQISGKTP